MRTSRKGLRSQSQHALLDATTKTRLRTVVEGFTQSQKETHGTRHDCTLSISRIRVPSLYRRERQNEPCWRINAENSYSPGRELEHLPQPSSVFRRAGTQRRRRRFHSAVATVSRSPASVVRRRPFHLRVFHGQEKAGGFAPSVVRKRHKQRESGASQQ